MDCGLYYTVRQSGSDKDSYDCFCKQIVQCQVLEIPPESERDYYNRKKHIQKWFKTSFVIVQSQAKFHKTGGKCLHF